MLNTINVPLVQSAYRKCLCKAALCLFINACDTGVDSNQNKEETRPQSKEQTSEIQGNNSVNYNFAANASRYSSKPGTVPYFHIQISFTSTSSWAKLEIVDSENIMRIGEARIEGTANRLSAGFDFIEINSPEGEVTITADYALEPAALLAGLEAVFGPVTKGSSGQTSVVMYRIDETCPQPGNCPAGAEVGSVTVEQGTGEAPLNFIPDQIQGATPKIAPVLLTPRMAWAVYYPWYRNRDVFASNVLDEVLSDRVALAADADEYWTSNIKYKDRPLGPPDMNENGLFSYDPIALKNQVRQAIEAGIDGFLPYYRGTTHFTHGATDLLFEAASEISDSMGVEFRIGHHISPQGAQENAEAGQDPVDLLVDWATDYVQSFGSHTSLKRVDSKPLAIVYSTGLLEPGDWGSFRSRLQASGIEFFLVMDNGSSNSFDQYIVHFDGAIGRTIEADKGLGLGKQMRYNAIFTDEGPKLWLGEVRPGFDNTDRGEPKNERYLAREDGATLIQMFDEAEAHDPQWIRIVSWNEYYEHTHIEPSRLFGFQYYDITRTRVSTWKGNGTVGMVNPDYYLYPDSDW